jgi:ABC-type multidrug transport system fused ATPase/permease subunit
VKTILRVIVEAKRYKWLLIIAAVSTLLLAGVNLTAPLLMSRMIAKVAQGLDADGMQQVLTLTIMLLTLYLSRIVLRYFSNFMAHKAAWRLVQELRLKVYGKLQSLSMDYFRHNESGDLVSRTINDTALFEHLYAHQIPETITNFITLTGVMIILLTINPKLALIVCLPIPLILFSGWFFIRKIRPCFKEVQHVLGSLSAQLVDNYSGMQEIQAFGQQERVYESVNTSAGQYTHFLLRALNFSAVFHPIVEFLTALGSVFVVGFGGYLAYQHQLQVGDIVAFMLYLTLFYVPITGLATLLEQLQQSLAGVERVIQVLDAPPTIQNKPNALKLSNSRGAIRFEHVSFSYIEGVPVLKDVSFEAATGEMIAVVGATGVGKSTLAQLIARFYDPVSGVIKMDDIDLRDINLYSLRQNVAIVLQDTFLFNGTVAENIAFANPEANFQEIEDAGRIARIHEDIMEMPNSYETVVGERGARLSGGQKQRIAIARAVLCKSPILILDEATASVDVKTEADIQKAIMELAGKRTIIVIAHRMSTVRRADRILVFKDGQIIQQGTHLQLIQTPGLYKELCSVQEQTQSDDNAYLAYV